LKAPQYLSFETKIGRRGAIRIQLHDDDPLAREIGLDYIARVWYKNESYDIDWTNVFNGIMKTPSRVWYGNGNKLAIFYGSDSNELIDKALVMYPISSQTRAYKNDVASTVMKEYIEENIGANALVAQGRFIDHVNPVTVVYPTPAVGPIILRIQKSIEEGKSKGAKGYKVKTRISIGCSSLTKPICKPWCNYSYTAS